MKHNKGIYAIIFVGIILVSFLMVFMILRSIISSGDGIDEPNFDCENFELNEVKNEQIIHISNNYNGFMSVEKHSGESSGITNTRLRDVDYTNVSFSSKEISGIKTVSATKAKDCTLVLDIDSALNFGNARLVIVKGGEIVEYIELGQKVQRTYEVSGEHVFYVKLVGKEANIEISVARSIIEQ